MSFDTAGFEAATLQRQPGVLPWNNNHPTGSFGRWSEIPGVGHEETGPYIVGLLRNSIFKVLQHYLNSDKGTMVRGEQEEMRDEE